MTGKERPFFWIYLTTMEKNQLVKVIFARQKTMLHTGACYCAFYTLILIAMKKILILVAVFAGFSLTAQEDVVPKVLLTEASWNDGTTRVVFGHPTTLMFGAGNTSPIHASMSSITNVGYLSLSQSLGILGKEWKAEQVSSDVANRAADSIRKAAPGGYVHLYIERIHENRANLQYFFIIIRDKNDKTVYTKYFPYQAAGLAGIRSTWWNYVVTEIPVEVEYPFYIYVNDKQSEYLSDFKFRIEEEILPKAEE